MNFEYDSWNRIKSIAYPDGEVVTYGYDAAGQLFSMQGLKGQDAYGYIDDIQYDRYGSRKNLKYSNGTSALYNYDPVTLRLSGLRSYDTDYNLMQDLSYQYDNASNITAISNSAAALPNGLGGTYNYGYQYDSLYRLTASLGAFTDANNDYYYNQLAMSYSLSGNITQKDVTASLLLDGNVQSVNYQNAYTYNTNQQPHTLESAGNSSFGWDFNGNMVSQNQRYLCWDEENRLGAVRDPEHLSLYLYNAGGERAWKFTGEVAQMTLSGKIQIDMAYLANKTLYASSFFVATDLGYTKHYFAGSERVCSKLGGGMAPAPVNLFDTVVEPLYTDYPELGERLNEMMRRFANCAPNELTVELDFDPMLYCFAADNLQANEPETEQYFYHPDHLGSSSFISDANGDGYQHLQYLPFGETAVSQKLSSWTTPYQFSAKEKDEETGYSYFGARYYNSDISVWLCVDPMSDKRPSHSPYNYCQFMPVNKIDIDGRLDDWVEDANGNITWRDDVTSSKDKDLKSGEVYRGKNYERYRAWDNKRAKGVVHEMYKEDKVLYYKVVGMEEIYLRAYLSMIREGEGHGNPLDYNAQYGNHKISNYKDHPRKKIKAWGITGTAAGAYQFTEETWNGLVREFAYENFSPIAQDLAAIQLLNNRSNAFDKILKGNISGIFPDYCGRWSSLPGGRHQFFNSESAIRSFNNYVILELNNSTIIASPLGSLIP
jgi:RHS repeat-associated protein